MGLFRGRRQPPRTIWRMKAASCASRRSATSMCMEDSVAPYRELFTEISGNADVLVLCGDLTNFGKTSEAEILAEDIRSCPIPVLGVLGNHDYECGQPEEVAQILHEARDDRARRAGGRDRAASVSPGQGLHGRLRPRRARPVRRTDRQGVRRRKRWTRRASSRTSCEPCAPSAASPCSIIRRSSTPSRASPRPSTNISARSGCAIRSTASTMSRRSFHGHAHHGTYEGRTPRGTPVYNVAQFVLKPLFGKPYAIVEI